VPCAGHVVSTYTRFPAPEPYAAAMRAALEGGAHDFVEGIVLARDDCVLVTAEFGDAAEEGVGALPEFRAWGEQAHGNRWYYQHCGHMATAGGARDRIPVLDFLFKHQRGFMWCVDFLVNNALLTRSRWGRTRIDAAVAERAARGDLHKRGRLSLLELERCRVFQDVGVRLSRLVEAVRYIDARLGIYPLWNCPYRAVRLPGSFPRHNSHGEAYCVDVGIYGEPKTPVGFRNVRDVRALQLFVDHPSCYGIVYLTPEELKARKNWAAYEALREKYYADDAFVPFLEKVRYVVQDGKKELGPIFMWRAKDKGEFGRAIAFLGALLAIAVAVVYWAVTALASALWA